MNNLLDKVASTEGAKTPTPGPNPSTRALDKLYDAWAHCELWERPLIEARLMRAVMSFVKRFAFNRFRINDEDFVNEVGTEIMLALPTFRGRSGFYTWVYTVAFQLCHTEINRARNRFTEPLQPCHEAIQSSSAGTFADQDLVRDMLSRLSGADRDLLTLRYFEGYTEQEIAAKYGWTRALVSKRIGLVRENLRRMYGGPEVCK